MWRPEHKLYPYQKRATDLMLESNTLLAFEMGTGKTPTTLWAIEALRGDTVATGTVVVPSSLKYQWAAEIGKFTDQAVVIIDGSPKKRFDQYESVAANRPGYMVMSYDTIVRDWPTMKGLGTAFMVLDEATAIKAFDTKRSKHLKKIAHRYPIRFALTGTPIENGKLEELFSIMQWVDEGVLGKWHKFEREYIRRNPMGWIEGYRNVGTLNRRLRESGTFARATHAEPEVASYLPKVVERPVLRVPLSKRAWAINEEIERRVLDDLDQFAASVRNIDWDAVDERDWNHPDGRMMAKITVLRQFLSRPESVLDSDSPFVDELLAAGLLDPVPRADKLHALFDYLDDFLVADEQNKAVVFASFVDTAKRIHMQYPNSVLLTGEMNARERAAAVEKFKADPATALFVSTDAGGYGLDLPQANLLVNFDLPWQPGLLAQRNARIKRASSKWDYVVVQNMLAEGTIEERMLEMLEHKMSVSAGAVDGEGLDEHGRLTSDLDSLRSFLQDSVVERV